MEEVCEFVGGPMDDEGHPASKPWDLVLDLEQ